MKVWLNSSRRIFIFDFSAITGHRDLLHPPVKFLRGIRFLEIFTSSTSVTFFITMSNHSTLARSLPCDCYSSVFQLNRFELHYTAFTSQCSSVFISYRSLYFYATIFFRMQLVFSRIVGSRLSRFSESLLQVLIYQSFCPFFPGN